MTGTMEMPSLDGVKHVLLDIEGTVCPISFVKDTLFPYALKALPEVVTTKWDDPAFIPYREAFPSDAQTPTALQTHVEDLTAKDIKVAYLKNLQGYLWEDGYKSGAYSTPLFQDVAPQLKAWKKAGLELAIYSSGSVFAQKLLFGRVEGEAGSGAGTEDLRDLLSAWFDTTNAGLKTEVGSYTKIEDALSASAESILFLSDNVKEIDAAIEAGMKTILVDRPGNHPLSESDKERLSLVTSFDEIELPADIQPPNGDGAESSIGEKRKADETGPVDAAQPEPKAVKKSQSSEEPLPAAQNGEKAADAPTGGRTLRSGKKTAGS